MDEAKQRIRFGTYASRGDIRQIKRMLNAGYCPTRGDISCAASDGHLELVKLLLDTGAYLPKHLGQALCPATMEGHLDCARLLLDTGADPNFDFGDFLGIPPLLSSAENGDTDFVKELLDRGADPNTYDIPAGADLLGLNVNKTALMVAAEKGHIEIVRLLLGAGADPTVKGIKNKTAYELIAKKKNRQAIAKLLLGWQKKKPVKFKKLKSTFLPPKPPGSASTWKELRIVMEEFCGTKSAKHGLSEKTLTFPLSADRVKEIIRRENLRTPEVLSTKDYDEVLELASEKCASIEASAFLSFDSGKAQICVVPWKDKFKTIAALQTGSANYGVTTKDLILALKKINALNPFNLLECGTRSLAGEFVPSYDRNEKKLASMLIDLSPFVLDDHSGKIEKFENAIKYKARFTLWWD